jgi:mevalonate kinase
MAAISAHAPGKIILFGEHSVVYGRRAVAIPVHQVQARAGVFPLFKDPVGTIRVISAEINLDAEIHSLPEEDPIRKAVQLTLDRLEVTHPPAMQVRISSTIPVAGGMGSGAAVSVAIARGVSTFLGLPLPDEAVSAIAFEVEKIHHGTPSGIDNTVIAFNKPVLFKKGEDIRTFSVGKPLTFLIANTGIKASTAEVVQSVREKWQADPGSINAIFDQIDALVGQAVQNLQVGDEEFIGRWMSENHSLLQRLDVSCPELDRLVSCACANGAFGAKLSGAGRGGNMIALIPASESARLEDLLKQNGAVSTLATRLEETTCNS